MRRQSKYSPHLMTISETSTIAVTTKESVAVKRPSPIPEVANDNNNQCEDDRRQRVERSQSAPPVVEREVSRTPAPSTRARSSTDLRDSVRSTTSSSSSSSASTNKYGRSALHNAVRKGDKRAIARLLREQPELLREPDARGNLPLHYAANPQVPDHTEVLYVLLRAGSPVNVLNARGQSPLVVFVEADDDLPARMLLHYHSRPAVRVTEEHMLAPYAVTRGLYKIAAAVREFM